MRPMVSFALTALVLVACQRDEALPHPHLYVDPGRIDLSVDSPLDGLREDAVTVANIGTAPATIAAITLEGERSDLLSVDNASGFVLEPGEVLRVSVRVRGAVFTEHEPFYEELDLVVLGEPDPNGGSVPAASAVVGFGTLLACDVDADGYISADCGGDDCDDALDTLRPGADERCNGVDDDCDGFTDEASAVDAVTWWADADGDLAGDALTPMASCEPLPGWVLNAQDCDDSDAAIQPDATERCNGVDDDCDGTVDNDAIDAVDYFADHDSDGHGEEGAPARACLAPAGFASPSDDCDDADPAVYVGATEACDGRDNDCDGQIDEDGTAGRAWYADRDGDGHGDPATGTRACVAPRGFVDVGGDCNDGEARVHPGAVEACDGVDQDCDGLADDGTASLPWYQDRDGDGYGFPDSVITACAAPSGYVGRPGDCDDRSAAIHQDAIEVCDGKDQDCDGLIDDGAGIGTGWRDADGDGYGDASSPAPGCADPGAGYVTDKSDCDDTDAAVHPAATEWCDGRDEDCDGQTDEQAADALTWYLDADGDRFGSTLQSRLACDQPAGYSPDATDCDDRSGTIYPGAPELCDGIDQNCNGALDDGAPGRTWYADADRDGYGTAAVTRVACVAPSGYIATQGDCDDRNPAIRPDAAETCNGRDDDCDASWDEGGVCPCPVFDDGASIYQVCDVGVPAQVALSACRAFGYNAADLASDVDDAWLDDALDQINPGASFYVGLTDRTVEGRFEWVSGAPVTFTDWAPGQPADPSGQEDCVVIDANRQWQDVRCQSPASFVCEAPRR